MEVIIWIVIMGFIGAICFFVTGPHNWGMTEDQLEAMRRRVDAEIEKEEWEKKLFSQYYKSTKIKIQEEVQEIEDKLKSYKPFLPPPQLVSYKESLNKYLEKGIFKEEVTPRIFWAYNFRLGGLRGRTLIEMKPIMLNISIN